MPNTKSKVTTSHWGAFRLRADNGQLTSAEPFELDPAPPTISKILPAAVHHKTRVAKPSIRKGWLEGGRQSNRSGRGIDEFVELPWDEALDITAQEIERIRGEFGNEAIFGGSYGWASAGRFHHALGQIHRFLNSTGGYVASFASYSTAAAQAIIPHVFGMNFLKLTYSVQNSWPMISEHTDTLVMFGGINPKNSQVNMGGITKHDTRGWLQKFQETGKHLVTIAPQRNDGPAGSHWMQIIPGTDTAFMLGIAYVLETEGLADNKFLERCCSGYDRFKPYLLGESDGVAKTPQWAESICGLPTAAIVDLARRMANTKTLITVAWSLQRAQNGEQPFWMAAVLASMLGQIGQPGCGIGYGYGAIGGVGVAIKRLPGITLPQGENPVKTVIPVARMADMLLHPNEPYEFNGEKRTYPDIRLVYWCGGNPFHHHQDLNRLAKAWQQPETIIVNEPWWTPTAKHSDIVFPATTPYEREDIGRTNTDSFLFHMPQIIPPVGEARDDYSIFSGLAHRLGCEEEFTEGRSAEEWIQHLYDRFKQSAAQEEIEIPDLTKLKESNWVDLPIAGSEFAETPFKKFATDPDSNPLETPSGKIEIYSETIESFGYSECPGHPIWQPPDEWLGSPLVEKYPFHLVSPQPEDKLHSQLESAIADIDGERPAPLVICREDAISHGINNGDIVRVFNDRGSCMARAQLSDAIRAGVVSLPTGAWYSPAEDGADTQGNPNILTFDKGTSRLGQGCSAHTTLVGIEKP